MPETTDPASLWQRRYEREKTARLTAEQLLEDKSRELYQTNLQLQEHQQELQDHQQELEVHQQELETHQQELEAKVEARTLALREAHDQALASAQAKSDFLANMSHEIRTPMNGVLGMMRLLDHTHLSQRQKELLSTARHSGEDLLLLINDILDFSKIESGKLDLENTDFNPIECFEQVAHNHAASAAAKNLEFICHISPTLPPSLSGDPTRLKQVVHNLLSNAVKFTDQGQVALTVNYHQEQLQISVRDSGIGMSSEQIAGIFEAFSQADTSTTRKFGGTGLGLAICRRIIDAMGSQLSVESQANGGSCFHFAITMPALACPVESERLIDAINTRRLLIVDDHQSNLDFLEELAQAWGFNDIRLAHDGRAALKLVEQQHFDIVWLDRDMPGFSGVELAAELRTDPKHAETIIIGFDALNKLGDKTNFDALIAKPVRQSELYDALLEALDWAISLTSDQRPADYSEALFLPAKILLVDDNAINLEVASETLAYMGLSVITCVNGQEAVDWVQRRDFDAVLMDIQMPVMDGLTAAREIRQLGGPFKRLPIIALSAHALAGDREKSLAAGMDEHLTKPIDPVPIHQTLARWLPLQAPEDSPGQTGQSQTLPFAQPTTETPPKSLPGLNIAAALGRLNGRWALLKKIIGSFTHSFTNEVQQLQDALAEGNWAASADLAHAIKGGSASIGAESLSATAAAIEHCCRLGEGQQARSEAKPLQALFDQVKSSAELLADTAQTEQSHQQTDRKQLRAQAQALIESLDTDLGQAQQQLETLSSIVGADFQTHLQHWQKCFDGFELDVLEASIKDFLDEELQ